MTSNLQNNQNIIVYEDGEIGLEVSVKQETIWLSQAQISELFETSTDNVSLHLKNIYKEKELDEDSTTEDFSVVRQEGKRKVKRTLKHYSLDAIISVGYRVSSYKATKFRQWATSVLKEYILNGYTINIHKITEQRLMNLENDMKVIKSKIKNDEAIFSKYPISFTVATKSVSKSLKIDIEKYNKQYNNLTIKTSNKYHDKFLVIDNSEIYHIGASIKDLGNKVFAFSKLNIDINSFELSGKSK